MRPPISAISELGNRARPADVPGTMPRVAMRHISMRRIPPLIVLCAASAVLVAGCQLLPFIGGSSASPLPQVTTGDQAARLVLAKDARFSGLPRRDPNLIGQGSWWDASPAASGFEVTVQIGWGDCEAGCISRHTWVYSVAPDATVRSVSETGDPLPAASQGNV